MKNIILTAFCLFIVSAALSQEKTTTTLKGKISAPQLEGAFVHIINTTQQTGTVNASSGNFEIQVEENDLLLFSSIQYKNIEVKITSEIFKAAELNVKMEEEVNELSEVSISNIALTGNINVDLDNIVVEKDLPMNIRFSDVKHTRFESDVHDLKEGPRNLAYESNMVVQPGSVNILGAAALIADLLNISKGPKPMPAPYKRPTTTIAADIRKLFDDDFFKTDLEIKEDQINDFLFFVDENGLTAQMLEEKNKLTLIDFLFEQSKNYKAVRAGN